jgi:hypothetical protein
MLLQFVMYRQPEMEDYSIYNNYLSEFADHISHGSIMGVQLQH